MKWSFSIYYNGKNVNIDAEIIYSSAQIEKIRLTIGANVAVVENNRPLLKAKHLNKKLINWKLREGSVNNAHAFALMLLSMEEYLRMEGQKPFVHPKNH